MATTMRATSSKLEHCVKRAGVCVRGHTQQVCGRQYNAATPLQVATAQTLAPKVQHGGSLKQELWCHLNFQREEAQQVGHHFYSHWFRQFGHVTDSLAWRAKHYSILTTNSRQIKGFFLTCLSPRLRCHL